MDLDAFLDRFDTPIAVTRFRRDEVFDGVMYRVHVKIFRGLICEGVVWYNVGNSKWLGALP